MFEGLTKLFKKARAEYNSLMASEKDILAKIDATRTAPRNTTDQEKLLFDAIDRQGELWFADAKKYFGEQLMDPNRDGHRDWQAYQFLSFSGGLVKTGTVAPGALCFLFPTEIKERLCGLVSEQPGPALAERDQLVNELLHELSEVQRKLAAMEAEARSAGLSFSE